MKETETVEGTPEQLLQIIAGQRAARRQQSGARRNRAIILVVGLIFIVIAAGVALLVLDQMLEDLRPHSAASSGESATSGGNL